MVEELERVRAELTRTVESASGQRETAALRAQLEQQAEELAGLQKAGARARRDA